MVNSLFLSMKTNTKKTLSIYWQHCKNYKTSGWLMFVTLVIVQVIDNVTPLFYKKIFNLLASNDPKELVITATTYLLVGLLIAYLSQWFLRRISAFAANHFESKIMTDLGNHCYSYLLKNSFSYFNNNFVGSMVKRVKWFTGAFEAIADRLLWDLLPLVVSVVVITIVLGTINIWLAIGMLVWVAVFLAINWAFANFKIKYDLLRNEAETENSGRLADTITNNANVKLFNGYKREVEGFADSSEVLRLRRKWSWDLGSYFDAAQGFLAIFLEIAIFYFAIKLWQKGVVTIGDFVLIQAYIINILNRIWGFGNVIRKVYESLSDAEEMTVILDTPHEIVDVPNAKELKVKEGKIEFKDVVFNYHETRTVLDHLNLTINAGETIAVIGPSGAGKTTIIKLLLRMHDLTAGQIFISGQDISKVTQESLWQNVSLVPQDPILFHRTLMENIRYGKSKASDKEVIEASKKAHCHEFITHLEKGYDTLVGERGIKLSGGERQRVAIARAILRNAPILVLDEATSSLDSESEHYIQEALAELMKNKTVVVVAHRLSTIKHADRIIVVKDGKIVEEGTHDDLANKKGGLYKKLWHFQAGGFVK